MRSLAVAATAVFSVGLAACIGTIQREETSPDDGRDRAVEVQTVAVMPVHATGEAKTYCRLIEKIVRDELARRYGEDAVVPASRARRALRGTELARQFTVMMVNYDNTGVLDAGRVRRISDAVGAPQLLFVTVRTRQSPGDYPAVVRRHVRVDGKLVSRDDPAVVWEGEADVDRRVEDDRPTRETVREVGTAAVRSLVGDLP